MNRTAVVASVLLVATVVAVTFACSYRARLRSMTYYVSPLPSRPWPQIPDDVIGTRSNLFDWDRNGPSLWIEIDGLFDQPIRELESHW